MIETVITPREGCKLVVRSSKGNGQEDYYVDAVEVVSFGHSFFFRSLERPKSFLVPVSDYEILELRETRMVLKNATSDRSLKIGGGRDAPPRREPQHEERSEPAEETTSDTSQQASSQDPRQDRNKRGDRRRRGRRGGRDRDMRDRPPQAAPEHQPREEGSEESEEGAPVEPKAPSFISKLFPPPPTLIKETLGRYKPTEPIEGPSDEAKEESSSDTDETDTPDTKLEE